MIRFVLIISVSRRLDIHQAGLEPRTIGLGRFTCYPPTYISVHWYVVYFYHSLKVRVFQVLPMVSITTSLIILLVTSTYFPNNKTLTQSVVHEKVRFVPVLCISAWTCRSDPWGCDLRRREELGSCRGLAFGSIFYAGDRRWKNANLNKSDQLFRTEISENSNYILLINKK